MLPQAGGAIVQVPHSVSRTPKRPVYHHQSERRSLYNLITFIVRLVCSTIAPKWCGRGDKLHRALTSCAILEYSV